MLLFSENLVEYVLYTLDIFAQKLLTSLFKSSKIFTLKTLLIQDARTPRALLNKRKRF